MNFAVYASMQGACAAYMGVFGRDRVADHIIHTLDSLGIDHSHARQYDGENGYAKVMLRDGDREFIGSNRGGVVNQHPLVLDGCDLEYIKGFDLVHTSNNGHLDRELPKLREANVPISYDFSGHWKEDYYLNDIAPFVDLAFMSCSSAPEDEIMEALKAFHAKGCKVAVATRGSLGAISYDGGRSYSQAPEMVEAVDTLGAGDSFAAAFLVSYLQDRDIQKAMRTGAGSSAKTCLVNGAFGHGISFEDD